MYLDGQADYYEGSVVSVRDYYPFGYQMPSRTIQSNSYRYGFNGKEKDENGEWGSQTHYDYGFRIYNPSIAKFLSVDPLSPNYPWWTPYQFAGNSPIFFIDLDGAETYRDLGNRLDPVMQKMNATDEDFEAFNNGFKIGMGIAGGIVLVGADVYFTGGQVSRGVGAFFLINTLSPLHYYDRLSPDEQIRVKKQVKDEIAMELIGLGAVKALSKSIELGQLVIKRGNGTLEALDDLPQVVVSSKGGGGASHMIRRAGDGVEGNLNNYKDGGFTGAVDIKTGDLVIAPSKSADADGAIPNTMLKDGTEVPSLNRRGGHRGVADELVKLGSQESNVAGIGITLEGNTLTVTWRSGVLNPKFNPGGATRNERRTLPEEYREGILDTLKKTFPDKTIISKDLD